MFARRLPPSISSCRPPPPPLIAGGDVGNLDALTAAQGRVAVFRTLRSADPPRSGPGVNWVIWLLTPLQTTFVSCSAFLNDAPPPKVPPLLVILEMSR